MADIRAFRAFRYDLGRVGALADVVAPPYDVIGPDLQQALYERSPYNVVRLILNKEEPGDDEQHNRYTRAARLLREWQADDVLTQDTARALYVYHQEFEVEGRRYTRKGFLARVRLEPFGAGRIFPHEETLPGPKADRLKLFRATGMNLSPVFGLYPDPGNEVTARLEAAVARRLPLEAVDHLGVVNRLWPVGDQQVVSAVAGLLGPKPLFIADGHHRYETALRYREERAGAGELRGEDDPANFVLMMLVCMSDPGLVILTFVNMDSRGLVILPTHRLIWGLPERGADRLAELLGEHFEVERVGEGEKGARDAWELIEADGGQDLLGFGTAADGVWQTARLRAPGRMAELAPQHSPAWRGLAVAVLHVLVLEHLLGPALKAKPRCEYVHLLREATEAVSARRCRVAALVPLASMAHFEQIEGNL